jgi:hypothetical protein
MTHPPRALQDLAKPALAKNTPAAGADADVPPADQQVGRVDHERRLLRRRTAMPALRAFVCNVIVVRHDELCMPSPTKLWQSTKHIFLVIVSLICDNEAFSQYDVLVWATYACEW